MIKKKTTEYPFNHLQETSQTNQQPISSTDFNKIRVAAKNNDLETIQHIVGKERGINASTKDGTTLLMDFLEDGDTETCLFLLKNGANVHARDCIGDSVFSYLPPEGEVDSHQIVQLIQLLVDCGADINARNRSGRTVLMNAAMLGEDNFEIIQTCLDNGADINKKDINGQTALILAVTNEMNDTQNILQFLLDKGADINARDKHGKTALMYAVQSNNLDAIRLLLKNGAEINAKTLKGKTVFDYAWKHKDKKVRDLLMHTLLDGISKTTDTQSRKPKPQDERGDGTHS